MAKLQRHPKPTSFETKKKISIMTEADMEERRYVGTGYAAIELQREPAHPERPHRAEGRPRDPAAAALRALVQAHPAGVHLHPGQGRPQLSEVLDLQRHHAATRAHHELPV